MSRISIAATVVWGRCDAIALALPFVVEDASPVVGVVDSKTSASSAAHIEPDVHAGTIPTTWSRQAFGRSAWPPAAASPASTKALRSR